MTLLASYESTAPASAQKNASAPAWICVGLLFSCMLLNYADRAVIGLAAKPIIEELKLTPSQFGLVGSSFFFLFSISAALTGFALARVQSRFVLLGLVGIWSLVQFSVLGVTSLEMLIVTRMALGAGEGPAYPMALHAAYKWFPDEKRTLPTAIITQGSALGVVVATPVLSWIIIHYSWRAAYGALGLCGLLWLIAWALFGREGPINTAVTAAGKRLQHASWRRLILNGTVLGSIFATFAAYWSLALTLSWFTRYVGAALGFSQQTAGSLTALPWAGGVFLLMFVGWFSQRLMSTGHSSRVARVLFVCAIGLAGGACLLALPFAHFVALKLALVCFGLVLPNAIIVPGQAIIGEVSPVAQRAALLGLANAIAGTAGLIAPYLTGRLIEAFPGSAMGYDLGFAVCGLVVCLANALGLLLIRPAREAERLQEKAIQEAPVGARAF